VGFQLYESKKATRNTAGADLATTGGETFGFSAKWLRDSLQGITIDWRRAAYTSCFGFVLNGFVLTRYYRMVDRLFGSTRLDMRVVGKKVVFDEIVCAPFCIVAFLGFSSVRPVLPGAGNCDQQPSSAAEVRARLASVCSPTNIMEAWRGDICFWPPVNFINFRFIPVGFRPAFIGFGQVIWQVYLSHVANRTSVAQV
jgi:hypothetical protein